MFDFDQLLVTGHLEIFTIFTNVILIWGYNTQFKRK